ncbi:MAG: mismatch-specific DNA-glycosylase, partial [Burkholderia sp.]|nr:mismatch-specific DNA-glycosylase [Burkholderia sp.]
MAQVKPAHILPDQLKPGLKLVFCGTAAGRQSALQQAYYAHGQNKFWTTLHKTGL